MLNPRYHLQSTDDVERAQLQRKKYIGTAETDFKQRFKNHTKSFNLEHHKNDTELSKEYWTIKATISHQKSPGE